MTQEDIDLLFKDLCTRLPYGVKVKFASYSGREDCTLNAQHLGSTYSIEYLRMKPYLRPMSSMTKEEKKEFSKLLVNCIEINDVYIDDEDGIKYPLALSMDAIDWLNAHHFDYRGLIEKGLALEALEGMYE